MNTDDLATADELYPQLPGLDRVGHVLQLDDSLRRTGLRADLASFAPEFDAIDSCEPSSSGAVWHVGWSDLNLIRILGARLLTENALTIHNAAIDGLACRAGRQQQPQKHKTEPRFHSMHPQSAFWEYARKSWGAQERSAD
jgi:hypothetical protein